MPETPTLSGASFAQKMLQAGLQAHNLRIHSSLRDDEWKSMDEQLVPAAVDPLRAAQDLLDAGLTRNLRNRGFGVLLDQWENVSKMDAAVIDMDAETPPSEGGVNFEKKSVPMPVIHKGFRMSIRQLQASRTTGDPLDVTTGAAASRQIGESLEDLVLNGSTINIDGNQIYGYTNHPSRNTGTLTAAWTDSNNRDPIADVLAMMQDLHDAGYHGPYWLYLPPNYATDVEEDYKSDSERTFRQRLMAIEGIDRVRVLWKLSNGNVLLVQPSREVVDLAVAVDPQPIEWESRGGLSLHFEMVQVATPRVKADQDGNSGIAHYTEPT